MVLRLLFRYLNNNEHLINKLADSKPIRRMARFVVHMLNRTSTFNGTYHLPSNTREFGRQIFSAARKLSSNFKKELKDAQDEIKKKQSK